MLVKLLEEGPAGLVVLLLVVLRVVGVVLVVVVVVVSGAYCPVGRVARVRFWDNGVFRRVVDEDVASRVDIEGRLEVAWGVSVVHIVYGVGGRGAWCGRVGI